MFHSLRRGLELRVREGGDLNWTPAALLPNLFARKPIDGEVVALAPSDDARVLAICDAHSQFKELRSRFTDAFNVPLDPMVLLVRDDALPNLGGVGPLASFRDIIALSVIPYAGSLGIVYRNGRRIFLLEFVLVLSVDVG